MWSSKWGTENAGQDWKMEDWKMKYLENEGRMRTDGCVRNSECNALAF